MADSAPWVPLARVCSKCEHAMVLHDHNGNHMPQTDFSLIDHLPDLAQLRRSAQQGCDFCRFLRTLIFQDETRDSLQSDYQTDIASLGSLEIKITVSYKLGRTDSLEDTVKNYLVVQVSFGSYIQCNYWNSLNSVYGTYKSKNFLD